MAKKFFYVCSGILMLALSYHFGARSAGAQAPANAVVSSMPGYVYNVAVVTANGDIYGSMSLDGPWRFASNVFAGPPPTPIQHESFGSVKARYR
jgi:hypothetical protein